MAEQPATLGRPIASDYGRAVALQISMPAELDERVRAEADRRGVGKSTIYQEAVIKLLKLKKSR